MWRYRRRNRKETLQQILEIVRLREDTPSTPEVSSTEHPTFSDGAAYIEIVALLTYNDGIVSDKPSSINTSEDTWKIIGR